jgi:hypothetical protein
MLLYACEWQSRCLSDARYPSLSLPASSEEIDFSDAVLADDKSACLKKQFGSVPWKTLVQFDTTYHAIRKYMEADSMLTYASFIPGTTALLKVDSTARYHAYLLQGSVPMGTGSRDLEVLLTVNPEGEMIDNLIVSIQGWSCRGTFYMDTPGDFTMRHEIVSGENLLFTYDAVFQLKEDGHLAVTTSSLTNLEASYGEMQIREAVLEYGESIITLETGKPVLAAIEKAIFVDPLDKDYLDEKTIAGEKIYVGVGMAGVAEYTVFVLHSPMGDGASLVSESWTVPMPQAAGTIVSSQVSRMEWIKQDEDTYAIVLVLHYDIATTGRDSATDTVEKEYRFTYQPETGFQRSKTL